MSKAQAIYWVSMATLALPALGMALRPKGFFDGPKGG